MKGITILAILIMVMGMFGAGCANHAALTKSSVDSHGLGEPACGSRGPLPGLRLPPVGVVTVGIYERAERVLSRRLHEHCLWATRAPLVDLPPSDHKANSQAVKQMTESCLDLQERDWDGMIHSASSVFASATEVYQA